MKEQRQSNDAVTGQKSLTSPAASGGRGCFFLWAGALALVLAVLLHQSLFEGKGLVAADGIFNFPPWMAEANKPSNLLFVDQYLVFIPQHEFTHREFMQGRFPLWNPNLACGQPNLASIQGALLFPINLLLLPLDPFYAAGIAAFLKLFLAGLFTMLYLRSLGATNSGAFLSGLVFSMSGFMICWLGHPHVNCAMWLPLLLYLIEKSFQYGRGRESGLSSPGAVRVWAGFAIVVGCLLLGGHPPTMIQVAIFVGIYFLFRLIGEPGGQPLERVGLALGAAVLGLLLAAPQLLPFIEYYRHSSMDAASVGMNRAAIRTPINTMILYLFPRLDGSPTEGFEDTMLWLGIGHRLPNFLERTGYVGVLPWLFALFGVALRRNRMVYFHGITTVICLLAVYGMPPLSTLFQALPIIRDINPTRLVMVAGFCVAVLAGLGWDSFWQMENRRKATWLMAGFWIIIGFVLLCYWHRIEPRWKHLEGDYRSFLEPQFLIMAGNLAAAVALLLPSVRHHAGLRALIGLGWVTVDLLNFGIGLNPSISRDAYYPATPAIKWLQHDKTDFRILGEQMVLAPNTPELYGLKDARGSDFTTVRNYEELIRGKAGEFIFYRSADSLPKVLPLLGVKYVLMFNSPAPDPALFDLVYSNELNIYRNREYHDRVMPVFNYAVEPDNASLLAKVRSDAFNPNGILLLGEQPKNNSVAGEDSAAAAESLAHIVSDQPDEITIEASMSRPGFLLLLDTYFPGWKATVNGLRTPILRADYNFRAVQLPAGRSIVRFWYQPASFRLGMALFAGGLIILTGAVFWSSWRIKKANQ